MRHALLGLELGALSAAGADRVGRPRHISCAEAGAAGQPVALAARVSGLGGLGPRHPRTREMLAPGLSVEGAGP